MEIWNKIQGLIYTLLIFLNIDVDIFQYLVILMLADTFVGGIKATFVTGLQFSFKNMYRGIAIKSLLLLLPMATAILSMALGYDQYAWVLEYMFRAIVVSEFISIITNFLSIRRNKEIKNPDVLAMLLDFLKEKLINIVKNTGDNDKS